MIRALLHFFGATRAWFFCLLLLPPALLADNDLRVLASIRPLQIISNDIMRGVGQAEVLIDASQSPHHFQLKPSQMRLASRADLLIWISDRFETGLQRLKHSLPAHSARLELLAQLPAARDYDANPSPEHENEHEHAEADGHIWLSPDTVIDIARLISQQLSRLDPPHAEQYQQNATRLISGLRQWKKRHAARLQQRPPSYITDHQFLSHFEHSLGLPAHDSLRDSHDSHASIRHLSRLQERLKQSPVKCLLVTKLPLSPQARQISEQYRLKVQRIETLGSDNAQQDILDFFERIASALEPCLT